MFPRREDLVVCFAHPAYRMKATFDALNTGIQNFEVRDAADLDRRIGEADVVLASEMWHNGLIPIASRLRFIQSISSGTNQYDTMALAERGIRLASAAGTNAQAVAEHAIGLILAIMRHLPEARDNQVKAHWRGMIGDPAVREDELGGKTLAIVGLGRIGQRLARLAKAFDMTVIGFRRDPSPGAGYADSVHPISELKALLPKADFVALTCPLTPETARIINADTLGVMKSSAYLINVARGGCVDEPALLAALNEGRIAGAALDCTDPEPPAVDSPLWAMPNVFLTPHTGGETTQYEANVIEILMENLDRLWRGEVELRNQIV
ncbi:MAG: D-2-hydroxyacid dehydrogenase [Acetobacteraceae bacterium]|jgi:phosphoglycerate dehydrogenase-like enzyme